jgi:hypothetical protein
MLLCRKLISNHTLLLDPAHAILVPYPQHILFYDLNQLNAVCLKALPLGCSLQYWGSVGSWLRKGAILSLVTRAHISRAEIVGGGASVETCFKSFGLHVWR